MTAVIKRKGETHMANKFLESAKQCNAGSHILKDRTKMSTEDVINKYPNGVTITEFDVIITGDQSSYPVFAIAEDPKAYFNGGALASKIVDGWIAMYDGDIRLASDELKASGGVKFVLAQRRTKSGKTITTYTTVE